MKTAEDGKTGLQFLDSFQPDLVVLDLMLPDCSGYDLCKEITGKRSVPVIMLSAKNEVIDKVLGLELGAEDYMTKPFDNRELLARINVVLRRNESKVESGQGAESQTTRIVHEELTFDLESRRVLKNDVPVSLTAKEFKILETLLKRPDKIYTRDELLQIGWGYDFMRDYGRNWRITQTNQNMSERSMDLVISSFITIEQQMMEKADLSEFSFREVLAQHRSSSGEPLVPTDLSIKIKAGYKFSLRNFFGFPLNSCGTQTMFAYT